MQVDTTLSCINNAVLFVSLGLDGDVCCTKVYCPLFVHGAQSRMCHVIRSMLLAFKSQMLQIAVHFSIRFASATDPFPQGRS